MKGRKPKPTALKLLDGNPGKKKILDEPKPPGDMPEPPSHLDSYALDEWYRVAEGLNTMGVLDTIDMGSFAAYCCSYSRWCHAEEELAKLRAEGGEIATLIIKTKQGNYIQQPLIGISNVAARDMLKYAAEFGLTPSARARLGVDPGKAKKSKFNNLIGINGGKK